MAKRPGSSRPPRKGGSGRPPSGTSKGRKKPFKFHLRTPQEARDHIVSIFRRAEAFIKQDHPSIGNRLPFTTEILSYIKKDYSVTVDLRIMSIHEKVDIDKVILSLHEKIDQTGVNGTWLSVGFYNPPSISPESEEGYRRIRGQLFYRTFSRRWTKKQAVLILEQGRWSQAHFKKKHRRRPVGAVLRAWWNPLGKRPPWKGKSKR